MAEENYRRELDLEIPAAEVQKAIERVARVPGFRPGNAPTPLIMLCWCGARNLI
jgi:FKBP-type peptidyl-prolyl cis-trans isomerase (trigger factor)